MPPFQRMRKRTGSCHTMALSGTAISLNDIFKLNLAPTQNWNQSWLGCSVRANVRRAFRHNCVLWDDDDDDASLTSTCAYQLFPCRAGTSQAGGIPSPDDMRCGLRSPSLRPESLELSSRSQLQSQKKGFGLKGDTHPMSKTPMTHTHTQISSQSNDVH